MGLRLCPFCGSQPEVRHIGNEYVKKQVCEIVCPTLGCFSHQRVGILNGRTHTYEWAEQKCRERWSTRADEARIRRETIEECAEAFTPLGDTLIYASRAREIVRALAGEQ